MSEIQCVVVTPEKTEVDVRASSVTVPMFDGEMGILKGHSPLVGRLGFGILSVQVNGSTEKFFVEEGLVQVSDDVVTILTDRVISLSQINTDMAEKAMQAAITMPTNQAERQFSRNRAMNRARALSRVAASAK